MRRGNGVRDKVVFYLATFLLFVSRAPVGVSGRRRHARWRLWLLALAPLCRVWVRGRFPLAVSKSRVFFRYLVGRFRCVLRVRPWSSRRSSFGKEGGRAADTAHPRGPSGGVRATADVWRVGLWAEPLTRHVADGALWWTTGLKHHAQLVRRSPAVNFFGREAGTLQLK